MKRFVVFVFSFSFLCLKLIGQNFTKLNYVPDNIEIEVLNMDVSLLSTDDDFASYSANLNTGEKLSCVLNRGTFRVRSVYKTTGSIVIKIPKTKKLERLRISGALGNFTIKDLQIVHVHGLLTNGDIDISDCFFKTSLLTHNTGKLNFSAKIKSSMICVTNTLAKIEYLGETDEYNLSYNQANSDLIINGEHFDLQQGWISSEKPVKRALLSISGSVVNVEVPVKPPENNL